MIIPPRGLVIDEEPRCAFNEIDCNQGIDEPYCVPLVAVHDCIVDCPSFVDELCQLNETLCDTTIKHGNSRCGKCVDATKADILCADRKWKNLCREENTVQCPGNDNCVHVDWVGDGEDDCGNGADEHQLRNGTDDVEEEFSPLVPEDNSTSITEKEHPYPCDCAAILAKDPDVTQPVQIAYDWRCAHPRRCAFRLSCDFATFGGGWTVVMRRRRMDVAFNRSWEEYRKGFGSLSGSADFWLGNDRLHSLTSSRQCGYELLVRMRGAKRGNVFFARYEYFSVADERDNYRLKLGPLVAGGPRFSDIDGLLLARDRRFVTWDTAQHHCEKRIAGWWLSEADCGAASLTADFLAYAGHNGLTWGPVRLMEVEMQIRPRFFVPPVRNVTTFTAD